MIAVFADTYYWLALINPRDQAHHEALALSQSFTQPLVTTAWVLAEVGDAMSRPANRATFIRLLQDIALDPDTTVAPVSQVQFEEGAALFGSRLDKDWSLTDCITFVLMQRLAISDALTADHHFTQAGFSVLMK
jgi:uncharacterized protein